MLYYYQQGDILERANIINKLASLSESELSDLMTKNGIAPDSINLDKSTHSFSLHKIDDLSSVDEDPKQYFKKSFFSTLGFFPVSMLNGSFSKHFEKLFDLQKQEAIVGKKALEIELYDEWHEFKEDASINNYNVAFKRQTSTFDAGKFG